MTESIHPFLRVGLLGFGEHAKSLLESFMRSKKCALVAVASRTIENEHYLAKKFPALEFYSSYEALLGRPDIDVFFIATRNDLHFPLTKKALLRGKHVICEKPLCVSLSEARELSEISETQGVRLAEAFHYRQHPQHDAAHRMVAEGRIGRLRRIEVDYQYPLEDSPNYRLKKEQGGGILLDAGCYGVDCARFFFGAEPESITEAKIVIDESGLDVEASVSLLFSDSRSARIFCSMRRARKNSCTLFGDRKTEAGQSASIQIPNAFHVKPLQKVSLILHSEFGKESFSVSPSDQYAAFVDGFAEALTHGRSISLNTFRIENGLRNMEILQGARHSASFERTAP